MFKLTHPQDLISKLFILEYMRDLGANILYSKASDEEKAALFYKFEDNHGYIQVDINWEAALFVAPIEALSMLMEKFLDELEIIEAARNEQFLKERERMIAAQLEEPMDINLMDIAKADIKNSEGRIID